MLGRPVMSDFFFFKAFWSDFSCEGSLIIRIFWALFDAVGIY